MPNCCRCRAWCVWHKGCERVLLPDLWITVLKSLVAFKYPTNSSNSLCSFNRFSSCPSFAIKSCFSSINYLPFFFRIPDTIRQFQGSGIFPMRVQVCNLDQTFQSFAGRLRHSPRGSTPWSSILQTSQFFSNAFPSVHCALLSFWRNNSAAKSHKSLMLLNLIFSFGGKFRQIIVYRKAFFIFSLRPPCGFRFVAGTQP